ncbi:hypothetical protein [Cetobacterium sp.]|uniref:hypothetical protein n=1 Tax=Cetobacterium sp. TaxID=2071632 RepID=UPI003F344B86
MKAVSYNIIKILLQHPLHKNILLKYLNINILTLKNTIIEINQNLIKSNLPTIIEKDSVYSLIFNKKQRTFFYSSCNCYSQEQRCNYLLLKFLVQKKINLENERIILNVSRSTINRDFLIIKKKLDFYKITVISKQWIGLSYEINDISNFFEVLLETLMIFYSDFDYLPGILKHYLIEIQPKNLKQYLKNIFKTYEILNIQIGDITVKYLLTLKTCFHLFENFYLKTILNYIKTLKNKNYYNLIFKKLYFEYNFTAKLSVYIAVIIYDTTFKTFYLENTFSKIIDKYCNYFQLKLSKNERYLLMFAFHLSIYRYQNKIINVKNVYLEYSLNSKILKSLKHFFKISNIEIYYGDLLEIEDYTKYFLISNELKNKKSILILKKEINHGYFLNFKKKLENFFPKFIITFKPIIYFQFNLILNNQYDLILSDVMLDNNTKYKFYSSNMELIYLINEFLIEEHYSKISL